MPIGPLYIIVAYTLGIVLLFLEIYLPGGVIGILGGSAVIASIIGSFMTYGGALGFLISIAELIGVAFFIILGLKILPGTKAGKRLILKKSMESKEGYTSVDTSLKDLMDKQGTALTTLRPAGSVEIDNSRYNVVTQGEFIEKDSKIEVIEVEGNRVVVKEK